MHQESRHRCSYCPYSCDRMDSLVKHERNHTGQRPFVCDTYGKAFIVQSQLTRHRGVHTGEREDEEPEEVPSRTTRAETFFIVSSTYLPVFERAVV
ncbi:unnamed protein product [Ixodes pacificus]